jgi:hypothetical protein
LETHKIQLGGQRVKLNLESQKYDKEHQVATRFNIFFQKETFQIFKQEYHDEQLILKNCFNFNFALLQNGGLQPQLHFTNNILNCLGSSQLLMHLILLKGL